MTERVALVTGGTTGIGLSTALAFRDEGCHVHVCARSEPEGLPDGLMFHECDVGDAASVRAMFERIAKRDGRLDVLVNNAGIAGANPLDTDATDEKWHEILRINLTGSYLCAKAALPLLPDGTGRIVNVSSILGLHGSADQSAYSASKHGVIGLTRSLALALAVRGITVNVVCPSWVDTGMAAARWREIGITHEQAAADTPSGRIAAPEDVAAAILFLASPAARHITGQAIPVDGGGSA
jgi:NAD(P)-dependent dehydrogenase (short-subunit alcohol dehydrogenase family)